jgi:hypothetical protein
MEDQTGNQAAMDHLWPKKQAFTTTFKSAVVGIIIRPLIIYDEQVKANERSLRISQVAKKQTTVEITDKTAEAIDSEPAVDSKIVRILIREENKELGKREKKKTSKTNNKSTTPKNNTQGAGTPNSQLKNRSRGAKGGTASTTNTPKAANQTTPPAAEAGRGRNGTGGNNGRSRGGRSRSKSRSRKKASQTKRGN